MLSTWRILIATIIVGFVLLLGTVIVRGYEITLYSVEMKIVETSVIASVVVVMPETTNTASVTPETPINATSTQIGALEKLNPALRPVCGCESSFEGAKEGEPQQFEKDGRVRFGRVHPEDKGMCQINTSVHGTNPQGFDILTEEGNVAFANYLYKKNGLRDWFASRTCWNS